MKNIPKIEWRPYVEVLVRRKWWIIIPVVLSIISGGIYLKKSPKTYRASTLILVEAQRVPRDFVPSTVSDNLQTRLQTISQQVHSRTNLESIIQRFELYPAQHEVMPGYFSRAKRKALSMIGFSQAAAKEQESEPPSMQQLVQNVRSKIDITLRARNQAFEISFEWPDPQVAARVTNAIASQFIDQNLRVREEMAMGTTRFLDSEVRRLQHELEQREVALEQFKRSNMGRLPSQLQSNLNILSQLKEELSRAENQSDQIRQQIQQTQSQAQLQAQQHLYDFDTYDADMFGNPELASLKKLLDDLRDRYTEQHPEVQAVKRRLERLENELSQTPAVAQNPVFSAEDMLTSHLSQMRTRLNDNERRTRELRGQIRLYEDRVEQTSEVELELRNLERDYNAVNDRFQVLLRRKLDAELAEQMERRQQGEQFRVIDPAITPDRPFKPDRNRIMFLAMVFGLGMGGGMAFLREGMDSAFYSSDEVEHVLKPKMLISLPPVKNNRTIKKRFFRWRR
ncbi:GumC family protein [Desulfonatronovibrio hydrogenovorans]|uniref:GumC family protein n=1 Tax=Desulfonatronovibrio hydrogenovorans TaxID=53245 RepID=UPI00048F9578|nr:Wzz/FepE/Etk N-terminal domain-containing protein [Desulfonatronovibrio hydrogenovorans]